MPAIFARKSGGEPVSDSQRQRSLEDFGRVPSTNDHLHVGSQIFLKLVELQKLIRLFCWDYAFYIITFQKIRQIKALIRLFCWKTRFILQTWPIKKFVKSLQVIFTRDSTKVLKAFLSLKKIKKALTPLCCTHGWSILNLIAYHLKILEVCLPSTWERLWNTILENQ